MTFATKNWLATRKERISLLQQQAERWDSVQKRTADLNEDFIASFEAFTAVMLPLQAKVFWVVTPCNVVANVMFVIDRSYF
jgi:hypothetical protein